MPRYGHLKQCMALSQMFPLPLSAFRSPLSGLRPIHLPTQITSTTSYLLPIAIHREFHQIFAEITEVVKPDLSLQRQPKTISDLYKISTR